MIFKLPSIRLSTRITIAAIALVVAGAMALMFIEEARLRDIYTSEQRANLEQGLHAEKLRLNQTIRSLRQDVLFLSNTPPVSGIVRAAPNHNNDARDGETREKWEAHLQQIFSAFSATHPDYYQIRYIGVADEGRELVRIDNHAGKIEVTPPARLQSKAGRDYFQATLGLQASEVYLSEFNLNREWDTIERPSRPTLRAATPVFTPSGQIFGMVVINMDATRLLESATLNLPSGFQAYITNMNGGYLFHPDPRKSFGIELGGKDNIATDFPLIKPIFNPEASEHLPLQVFSTKTGTQYLAAEKIHFDPGDPTRFLLLTYHIPSAVAAKQLAGIPAKHIVGGLLVMLLASGMVLLLLRRTFAPLDQIATTADKIAAGNHDVPLPPNGSGEIGSLVRAINAMLAKLSQREQEIYRVNAGLEEQVRKRTNELKASEARLRSIIEATPVPMALNDELQNITFLNPVFMQTFGYTLEDIPTLADWWPRACPDPEYRQWAASKWQTTLEHAKRDGKPFQTIEMKVSCKNGAIRTILATAAPIGGSFAGEHLIVLHDITGRKQAEETRLRESDDRFRGTLEQAAVGIAHTTMEGHIQQVNQKFCDIVGYTRDELLQMRFQDFSFPDDLGGNMRYRQQLLAGEISTFSIEKRYVRKDMSLVWVNLTGSLLRDADGTPIYYIGVIEDITERRQADMELNQSRKLLRELVTQNEALREDERKRISRELHDELGQILTALRMNVALLRIEFGENNGALLKKIKGITELLDQSIQCARNVVTNLRPVALDMGIVPAVRWLCDEFFKHTGTPCVLNTPDEVPLDEVLAVAAFRVVQESLTNVARYAQASKVEITLDYDADNFSVTVNDNGKGFDYMAISNHKSFGLLGMRERAIALGGVVNIYSAPQQGTQIFFVVPNKQTFTDTQGANP